MTPQHPRPISLGKVLLGMAVLGLLASGYLTGSPGASAVLQGQQAPVLQILTFNPSSGEFVGQPVGTPIMSNGQPSFGTSTALTVHPEGFVYIPNRSTNTIAVFTESGEQLGEPVPNASGANGPNGATIGPEGNCLYVTNQATSNVSTFRIQDDGRLEPGPGPFLTFGNNASQNASGAILVSRDGQRVYVSNVRSGDVTVFRRGEGCELTLVQGSPFSTRAGSNAFPLGMGEAVVNGETYLYVSNHVPGSITRFRVEDDGVLTAVGQPIQKGELTRNDRIVITEDSRFLYVSNLRGQGGISAFRIGSDGGLTPLDGSPFNTGRLFTDLDFGPNEEFLIGYTPSPAINQSTNQLSAADPRFRLFVEGRSGKRTFAIGSNGALDPVGSASVLTAFSESDDALDCRIFHIGNTDEVPDASGPSGGLPPCPSQQEPDIKVVPQEIDFGTLCINSSKRRSFVIQNTGNAPLHVNSVSRPADPFSAPAYTGFTVQPNGQTRLSANFEPTTVGMFSASSKIESNDPDESSVEVVVSGRAEKCEQTPSTRIVNPSDLAAAVLGDELQIEWVASNLDPAGTFEIWYRTPDGNWKVIEKREPGSGSITWTVPETDTTGVGRLWVGNLTNPDGETTEDKYEAFHETKLRFLQEGPAPSTRIINPSFGDAVSAGSEASIKWEAANLNPDGTFEVWVRLKAKDWQKLNTREPGPGSFTWNVPTVEQPTTAMIWVGNLTNPEGKGNVERYEVFDEISINIEPSSGRQEQCLGKKFAEFAESVFGDQGTLLAAWHAHHETGLAAFKEGNYEQAINSFEDYLDTIRDIRSRLEEDADGNGTSDLVDTFGVTDEIRNKLNQAITSFAQSIPPYEDFVRLRKQAAQAFIAGDPETAENLVEQSNQAVDRHVKLTDETVNTLKEVQNLVTKLPCRP